MLLVYSLNFAKIMSVSIRKIYLFPVRLADKLTSRRNHSHYWETERRRH